MSFLMPEVDAGLLELFDQVFTDRERQGAIEDAGFDADLWKTLVETGLARLTGAESSGGSGGSVADAVVLNHRAAYHAARVPLAEHDFLAGWLAEVSGLPADGLLSAAVTTDAGVARLPWGRHAETALLLVPGDRECRVVVRSLESGRLTEAGNVAGEPRDLVEWAGEPQSSVTVDDDVREQFRLRSALIRAAQLSGAMQRVLDLCVEHTTVRVQFGRPLAAFQAVQHLIVDVAAQVRLTEAAVAHAAREAATDWHSPATRFAVAVARSVAGHAATPAVRNGHQVHGAIGTTQEHRLHEFTTRLLAWRSEDGSTNSWDREVNAIARAAGPEGLWELLTLGE